MCESDDTDEETYKLLQESLRVTYSTRETRERSPVAESSSSKNLFTRVLFKDFDDHWAHDSNNTENGLSPRDSKKTEQIEQMKKLSTPQRPLKRFIKLPKLYEKLRDANLVWNGTIIQEEGTDF